MASVLALTWLKECFFVSEVKVQRREVPRVTVFSAFALTGVSSGNMVGVQREHSLSEVWMMYT